MADTKKTVKETAEKVAADAKEAVAETKKAVKKAADTTAKKATAAKKTTAKAATAKAKTAAKTTASKAKTTAKKAVEDKAAVYVQYGDKEVVAKDVLEAAKADFKANPETKGTVRSIKVYIKPEDNAAYYVVNDKFEGKIDL